MKKYVPLLAAIAIVVVLAILASTSCSSQPQDEPPQEEIPTSTENLTESMNIYYSASQGYLVPITRQVASADNMAQAALDLLHDTSANWTDAASLGVMPTLPEGATATVSVSGGIAQVDLSGFVCTDADSEKLAISSMTATLLDMPQIDVVHYTVNGKAAALLPFGTSIADTVTSLAVNAEQEALSVSAGESVSQVRLAFYDSANDLLVPVTRSVTGSNDLSAIMTELAKGPAEGSALTSAIPDSCELLGVSKTEDTAIIDMSESFSNLSAQEMTTAARALIYTAMQDEEVLDVVIRAGGRAVDTGEATATLPVSLNVATERLNPNRIIGNGTGDAIENDIVEDVRDGLDLNDGSNFLEPRQTTPLSLTPSPSPTTSQNPVPTNSPNRK